MAAGDFLTYKFPVWKWCVRLPSIWSSRPQVTSYREKGDPSKARDYLPADKQYLITHGVPCLRRATSLAYTDADEDAERLLNFSEASGAGDKDDGTDGCSICAEVGKVVVVSCMNNAASSARRSSRCILSCGSSSSSISVRVWESGSAVSFGRRRLRDEPS